MNSIRSRILYSYGIFGILILLMSLFAYNFINRADEARVLQNDILSINSQVLVLMDADVALRTEGLHDPAFFTNPEFRQMLDRDQQLIQLREELSEIQEAVGEGANMAIAGKLQELSNDLTNYENSFKELILTLKDRGFRDDGLEGEMRSYAHQLEKYPKTIKLEQLLSLRRREKDYFLRSDPIYVEKLNDECDIILRSLNERKKQDRIVIDLIEKYRTSFNEIVKLEGKIGTLETGLLHTWNQNKNNVIANLSNISESVNELSNQKIRTMVNRLVVLILSGLLITSIIGIASANLVSISIKDLARSMQKAIQSGFTASMTIPRKWATKETKSLYKSYEDLIATIQDQLKALEEANGSLTKKNNALNELIALLRESEDTLKASNELKDKFFSIIAHDLKGPMATNTMLLELMKLQINELSKDDLTLYTNKLHDTSSSILGLLEKLLEWAKGQNQHLTPNKETFEVNEVIDSILNLNKQRIEEKSIELVNQLPPNTLITADKNMMELVFRNLIDNAIKYTPNQGKVSIACEEKENKVEFHISDTGVGIAEKDKESLFTSLVKDHTRGTNGEKGIGLGLVLTFDFVRKNGGRLDVESRLNEGSTFKVCLPYNTDQVDDPDAEKKENLQIVENLGV